jgi:hypothetical protein
MLLQSSALAEDHGACDVSRTNIHNQRRFLPAKSFPLVLLFLSHLRFLTHNHPPSTNLPPSTTTFSSFPSKHHKSSLALLQRFFVFFHTAVSYIGSTKQAYDIERTRLTLFHFHTDQLEDLLGPLSTLFSSSRPALHPVSTYEKKSKTK